MATIDDKELKKLEKLLNSTVSNLLYGGCADPGWSELAGAAACVKTLQVLGLKIKGEKDVRRELGGENIHDENFLKTFDIE
jgi:hypothetical protein